ncbi:MAG: shikimate dehydrogenase [Candidatus Omnitrophica bacterium]|jgi:shikimate dehydrogenase|nr:shikimate dehydrogenase [Candidatus Omnitrophota bacterium]
MTAEKSTYGIIGYPVEHSLSPLMHNTAFKELGADAVYKLFPLQADELDQFFKDLKDKNSPIFGLNVTVPYKEIVIEHVDALSPFAKKAMSVNTIVIDEGRNLTGFNTDGPGFLAHLVELQFNTKGKRIAILGAGGTTRSILASLCLIPERPESIKIYNRTVEKAKQLVKDLSAHMDVSNVEVESSIDDLNIELSDLLLNTTSVGLKDPDDCLVDGELIHADMLVYDVVYQPAETLLLKLAKQQGAKTANGLGMLFYQGMLSLQHWAGQEIPQDVKDQVRKALEKGR